MRTLHLLLVLSCFALRADSASVGQGWSGYGVARAAKGDWPPSNRTELTFRSTFNCNLTGVWCFTGHYEEADSVSNNEYVLTLPFYCAKGGLSFVAIANYSGGDEFASDYDPALELFHNCTHSGKVSQIFKEFESVRSGITSSEVEYSLDLTNAGVQNPSDFVQVPRDRSWKWPSFVVDFIFHHIPVVQYQVPSDAPYFNNGTEF
ncbi:hypothetical protein CAEBREN_21745 [Caenorhabditis brenneri]|uniref:Uncharacterized protein n=1 Tax=Caenorhabditis brenneri TaxID=135651 RepID=G0N7V8_CAEBE|nr:hypothetical protein CAEBREN_21745 [Caenorhabditis brenneri]